MVCAKFSPREDLFFSFSFPMKAVSITIAVERSKLPRCPFRCAELRAGNLISLYNRNVEKIRRHHEGP